jgi:23S rRNA (adenine2503-C2)-methyltransferase
MSDLPAPLREELAAKAVVSRTKPLSSLDDSDGSRKLAVGLDDGSVVECVLLSDREGRKTACLSTQVGCPMGCAFCRTGQMGFARNLEVDEIIDQYILLDAGLARVSNVVFMGMGEPLLNLPEVRRAVAWLEHPRGPGISSRKITISTCGIAAGIRDLADSGPHVRLAVSITTADPGLRARLMPVEGSNPLPELREALAYYQSKTDRRLTLEAVILGGVNSRAEDATLLAEFIRPLKAQLNLIPWNPVPGLPFRSPRREEIEAFERALAKAGVDFTRRARRGRGVSGACGQLGSVLERHA